MSNLAQEEADRYFSYKPGATAHPEDADDDTSSHLGSRSDKDDEKPTRGRHSKSNTVDSDYEDEDDVSHNMSTMTMTKTGYSVPSAVQYANTGPKGVIADAQDYHRAKRSTFRRTLHSISDNLPTIGGQHSRSEKHPHGSGSNSGSDLEIHSEDDGDDEDFMAQWRANRLAELQGRRSPSQSRRISPSRRTYGSLTPVDANGYLDAIEKVGRDTVVVVLLYDPSSAASAEVEDELEMTAYKWRQTRFVKLHHEVAEMETLEIPAILAYKGGDVFATVSGARRDGLEAVLKQHGVLKD